MDVSSLKQTGCSTTVLQEEFSMIFKLEDFDIDETYFTTGNDATVRRKIAFSNRSSSSQIIGQSINFPSSWCVRVQCHETHARVALKFQKYLKDDEEDAESGMMGSDGQRYAIVKFRIKFIDKDGDSVYEKKWGSWDNATKINLGSDHAMANFISLEELFESQNFLLPNKTLRLQCEGVLYGNFVHSPIRIEKYPLKKTPGVADHREKEFDVQLVAPGAAGERAHKVILGNASEVLKGLLVTLSDADDVDELPSLQLDDLTESQVSAMVEYIYTGNIRHQDWSNCDEVENLITLGKTYELRGLRNLCLRKLLETVSLNNFPKVVKLFEKNNAESDLKGLLFQFFLKNQKKLIQTDSFKKFAEEDKDAFLYIVLHNVCRD